MKVSTLLSKFFIYLVFNVSFNLESGYFAINGILPLKAILLSPFMYV